MFVYVNANANQAVGAFRLPNPNTNLQPSTAFPASGVLISDINIPDLDAMANSGAIQRSTDILQTAYSNAANQTYSAASIAKGSIVRSGATVAVTDTTDTAANILACVANPIVGMSWRLMITNNNTASGAITFGAGAGVTITGSLAITTTGEYEVTITGVSTPAITITRLAGPAA